jgi:3-oxoacyl-[acyl-carrier-protein] synthase II
MDRRRVVITGCGLLSPLGDSAAELRAALRAGRSGLGPLTLFPADGLPPAAVEKVGQIAPYDEAACFGDRNLRPLDRFGRLVVATAQKALAASGWSREQLAGEEVGLILGTLWSGVRTIAEFDRRGLTRGPSYVSPLDFANTVINAAAGQAAIWHDLRGMNSTISGGAASGILALAYAADLLRGGAAAGALLAGGADELCFEALLGFHRTGRLSPGTPRPFAADRDGFALAEGAALLMLEEAGAAAARGARIYGEVLGHGSAFDSTRGGDPAAAAHTAERAIRAALADAGVEPAAIGRVSAAANGSPDGDEAEAAALRAVFGDRPLPVAAPKEFLGETLGAAGALQVIALLGEPEGPEESGERGWSLVNAASLDGQFAALVLAAPNP